jgi:hypothetical protein
MKITRNKGKVRWIASIRVGLLDEMGTARALEIDPSSISFGGASGVKAALSSADPRVLEVVCEAGIDAVEISCDGLVGTSTIARRSMADAFVKCGAAK